MRGLLFFFLLMPSLAFAWPATIVHVYDGDTITVAPLGDEDNPLFVRLYGIDAPDLKQSGGNEARIWLSKMLPEKSSVEIIPMGIDAYGRVYALLGKNGQVLNRKLLDEGHAWVWPKHCKAMVCRSWKSAEKKAQEEGKGLWARKNPVAPWLFGKGMEELPLLPPGSKPALPKDQALSVDPQSPLHPFNLIPALEGLDKSKKNPNDPSSWFTIPPP